MVVWIQNPFDNLPGEGFRKQRYWMMAEAFLRAGHRVVYWTGDFSHACKCARRFDAAFTPPPGLELRLVPTAPYRRNVGIARIASHRRYARTWRGMALAAVRSGAPAPSLIVTSVPTVSAASVALAVGRRLGARTVADVQDAWPESFERLAPKGFRTIARALLYPLAAQARRVYREADVVTGVCDRYRGLTGRGDYMRAYLGAELGARPEEKPVCGRADRIRLVYAGGLGRTYDLGTLVDAVEANGDFELDVAGFGDFRRVSARVRFHGRLPDGRLRALFAGADAGVVPMADDSLVGVPNKFIDYAAAGLAIVSSLGGESADLLAKYRCGATYRAGDPVSLAAAVRSAAELARGVSRTMCEREFDAVKIYDDYVNKVCSDD
ncbi:MAG: glycosyltransferase family 4 protein [Kiritimatiellae bacterium]|nr:glycosyltransferase family 4 protein [Kiritimatiellia bacterium]